MAEDLNELTQCPVCFEPYEENGDHVPRILPCHCTLCEACIKSLLNGEVLQCPQDRKIHKAAKGVMSFSQNKYIVAHLKKDTKTKTADYDECLEHKLKKILFCTHKDCQVAICPLCMGDDHLTHEVVNLVAEKKKQLFAQVETLTQKLTKYTDNIEMTKRQLDVETQQMIEKLKNRKQEVDKELDVIKADAMDSIATLEDIKTRTEKCTDSSQVVEKMEFVEQLNCVCQEMDQPVKCMFYKLVERTMLPDVNLSLISEVKANKYIKQGNTF